MVQFVPFFSFQSCLAWFYSGVSTNRGPIISLTAGGLGAYSLAVFLSVKSLYRKAPGRFYRSANGSECCGLLARLVVTGWAFGDRLNFGT